MTATEDYRIRLDVFEGPLDLLLYLIKRDELDIYDIPIERVTSQYLEYLNLMRMLDLNIAGEFIVMASTLMAIKSRMLLPAEERPAAEAEEDDPRWDLVRQLVEYKKFKDAAAHLFDREAYQQSVFEPGGDGGELEPEPAVALHEVSLFDLLTAFRNVLSQIQDEDLREIFRERFTVADKIEAILSALNRTGRIAFPELFGSRPGRHEVVCTFLALLELVRLRQVRVTQKSVFSPILVERTEESCPA